MPYPNREISEKCFVCGRTIRGNLYTAKVVGEETRVYVGPECYLRARDAGENGWRGPLGGAAVTTVGA